MTVRPGLEVLVNDEPWRIQGKNIGLVTNQSAVTSDFQHAVALLHAAVRLLGWTAARAMNRVHELAGAHLARGLALDV